MAAKVVQKAACVKRPSRPESRPIAESQHNGLPDGSPKADRPWENESPMNAAIPERRPATEEISGLIERVTFHNDESGKNQGADVVLESWEDMNQ